MPGSVICFLSALCALISQLCCKVSGIRNEKSNLWNTRQHSTCNYCNLFTHGVGRSSLELIETCLCIPDRFGIGKCWFLRRGENQSIWENPLGARERTNNKLNPHMASTPGFEPGPHWWEASALTTAPALLPFLLRIRIFYTIVKLNAIKIVLLFYFIGKSVF